MRKKEGITGFGARLRQLREECKITQQEMIDKVNDYFRENVYPNDSKRFAAVQAYNRYEIYNAQPDIDLLKAFSYILGVSVDVLIGNNFYGATKIIGANIAERRKEKGLEQWHMAIILAMSDDYYNEIESGNRSISASVITKIAYHLQCTPESLLKGSSLTLDGLPQTESLVQMAFLQDLKKCQIEVTCLNETDGILSYSDKDDDYNITISLDQLRALHGECMKEAENDYRLLMMKHFKDLFLRNAMQQGKIEKRER